MKLETRDVPRVCLGGIEGLPQTPWPPPIVHPTARQMRLATCRVCHSCSSYPRTAQVKKIVYNMHISSTIKDHTWHKSFAVHSSLSPYNCIKIKSYAIPLTSTVGICCCFAQRVAQVIWAHIPSVQQKIQEMHRWKPKWSGTGGTDNASMTFPLAGPHHKKLQPDRQLYCVWHMQHGNSIYPSKSVSGIENLFSSD